MSNLVRISTVAFSEIRFSLRRGGPIIGMATSGLILLVATLYLGSLNMKGLPSSSGARAGAEILAQAWPAFEWLVLGLLPIVAIPAIPSDRQFGVFELLRSLPLTGGAYLIGKVLGTVAAVLGTGLLVLTMHIILHLIVLGSPHIGLYLELTFFSGLPIAVWATTVGLCVGVGLRSRLTAILVGVPTAITGLFIWNASSWIALMTGRSLAGQTSQLTYLPISTFIIGQYGLLPHYASYPPDVGSRALLSIIIASFALICITLVARAWLLWKEDF